MDSSYKTQSRASEFPLRVTRARRKGLVGLHGPRSTPWLTTLAKRRNCEYSRLNHGPWHAKMGFCPFFADREVRLKAARTALAVLAHNPILREEQKRRSIYVSVGFRIAKSHPALGPSRFFLPKTRPTTYPFYKRITSLRVGNLQTSDVQMISSIRISP